MQEQVLASLGLAQERVRQVEERSERLLKEAMEGESIMSRDVGQLKKAEQHLEVSPPDISGISSQKPRLLRKSEELCVFDLFP